MFLAALARSLTLPQPSRFHERYPSHDPLGHIWLFHGAVVGSMADPQRTKAHLFSSASAASGQGA
jgi:hypothetical protein